MCEVLVTGPGAKQFRRADGAVSGDSRGLPLRRNRGRDRVPGA